MLPIYNSDIEYNKPNIPLRIVLSLLCIIFIYNKFIFFDNTKLKNVDMEPFGEPVQISVENGKTFKHSLKDGTALITPIAEYKIYGRVLDRHYRPYKLSRASMYPYDISIGFGEFKNKEVYDAISVKMAGMTSYYSYSGRNWEKHLAKYFSATGITHYFTNNHLCPANARVKKGLSKLRKKDIVYIEGYLIKFELNRKNKGFEKGISSTARNDKESSSGNGNGNCEQIFVTRVVSRHGDYK